MILTTSLYVQYIYSSKFWFVYFTMWNSPAIISLGKGTLGRNSFVGVVGELRGELALELSSVRGLHKVSHLVVSFLITIIFCLYFFFKLDVFHYHRKISTRLMASELKVYIMIMFQIKAFKVISSKKLGISNQWILIKKVLHEINRFSSPLC